jgi:hypothetical protein
MSKRAIGGSKVDSPADDDQVRMVVAVFPTVNGSFRFVIDGDHCAPEPCADDNLVRPLANLM